MLIGFNFVIDLVKDATKYANSKKYDKAEILG